MCKSPLFLIASLAVCLSLANTASAQKGKRQPGGMPAAGAKPKNPSNTTNPAIEKVREIADASLSPDKKAARERLKQAVEQYKLIDAQVEAHENRIRLQRSIRIPPGVRPPQIDPVPLELLQRRAAAWQVRKDAHQAYEQTP